MSNGETAIQIVNRTRDTLARLLPQDVDRERFVQVLLSAMNQPAAAKCEQNSLVRAAYGIAKLALNPDPALGHVYIVPRKGVATVQVGYRGYCELARRSRRIAAIHAEVVYANDDFALSLGTERRIHHVPWDVRGMSEPGETVGAYVTWTDMESKTTEFHRINRVRIERAMKSSESVNASFSPWKSDYPAMVQKTAVRDASKFWSLTPELAAAVKWDDQDERDEPQDLPEVVNATVVEKPDPLAGFGDSESQTPADPCAAPPPAAQPASVEQEPSPAPASEIPKSSEPQLTWKVFCSQLDSLAMERAVPPSEIATAKARFTLGLKPPMKGKEDKITHDTLKSALDAAYEGRGHFAAFAVKEVSSAV